MKRQLCGQTIATTTAALMAAAVDVAKVADWADGCFREVAEPLPVTQVVVKRYRIAEADVAAMRGIALAENFAACLLATVRDVVAVAETASAIQRVVQTTAVGATPVAIKDVTPDVVVAFVANLPDCSHTTDVVAVCSLVVAGTIVCSADSTLATVLEDLTSTHHLADAAMTSLAQ